jgi:hypothetical protein
MSEPRGHRPAQETLVKLSLRGGRYTGELRAAEGTGIEAVHEGRVVAVATLERTAGHCRVSLDLPPAIVSDAVAVVSLRSTVTGDVLDRVTCLAGDALHDDLRAEVALLRDELEMLKRAFRRAPPPPLE